MKRIKSIFPKSIFEVISAYGKHEVVDMYQIPQYVWATFDTKSRAEKECTKLNNLKYPTMYYSEFDEPNLHYMQVFEVETSW